jgi:small GTP-binding protein
MRHFKAVLAGDISVGKTAIFSRLAERPVDGHYVPTVSTGTANVHLSSMPGASLLLWDTAGSERFRAVIPGYFRSANVVILVFSVDCAPSFASVDRMWQNEVTSYCPPRSGVFLVGNKSDLVDQREISAARGEAKAEAMGAVAYVETCTVTGAGFDVLLDRMETFLAQLPPEVDANAGASAAAEQREPPKWMARGCC